MKRADKTKAWLERAKLVVAAARDRAAETTVFNSAPNAPSYGVAETPLGQEVEREVLTETVSAKSHWRVVLPIV